MMAYVLDPLALLGLRAGYNRPLDRHDFPHGHIPDSVAQTFPGVGELKRHANVSALAGSQGAAVDTLNWGDTPKHPLGTMAVDKVGNLYRYCQAGASALVVGNTIQSAAVLTNHFGLTSAAQAIGDGAAINRPIVVTPGATAGAANLYAEGDLFVSVTPGLGRRYRISGHAAITASTAFNLYLDPEETLVEAFTTSTRYGLLMNRFKNVIQFPVTTATGTLSGIAITAIAASNYGWLQTKGICNVLITGTPALGAEVMCPGTAAGAAQVVVAAGTLIVAQMIGHMAKVGVDGETNPVHVRID